VVQPTAPDRSIALLTFPGSLGARSTLDDRDEAVRAAREPQDVKPRVDELVADLRRST
jgi:hypothetical protein